MKFSTRHWILGLIAATGMALTHTANAQDAGADVGPKVDVSVQAAGDKATGELTPPATPEVPATPTPETPGSVKNLTDSIEGSAKTEADVDPSTDANAPKLNDMPVEANVDAEENVDADVNGQPMIDAKGNAAVDSDAQMRNRDRGDRNARWRYKNQNGVWWYWTPSNYWMVYRNGNWNRYHGPGYGHGGTWYDNYQPRTTTGYRGSPYNDGLYYRDNDGMRFYYNQGQRYYFDNNGRYYFGPNGTRTYDRQFADPDTIRGANTGAAIGGAIGGQRGAQIGAGIGGAIGAGSR